MICFRATNSRAGEDRNMCYVLRCYSATCSRATCYVRHVLGATCDVPRESTHVLACSAVWSALQRGLPVREAHGR